MVEEQQRTEGELTKSIIFTNIFLFTFFSLERSGSEGRKEGRGGGGVRLKKVI